MHQAGINIHKHTRPLTQVNFLGIHVLLIVCCVNIYLNTLQSPRSLHLAHHFPHAPNVERAAITHTHCVYFILKIKYTLLMRARDRARTLRRKKTNSQRHVYSHTPQTYLQHTRNTHASEEIQMHLDKLLKQQQQTGFSGEQKLTWHNTSAQRTAAQHSISHFYWKWMNAKRLYKTFIYVPLWWYFIVWSLWRITTSIKPQNVLKNIHK